MQGTTIRNVIIMLVVNVLTNRCWQGTAMENFW